MQQLIVFFAVRGPRLNTVHRHWSWQRRVLRDSHFPAPAGHDISDASQHATGLLDHLGTQLAHAQLAVNQCPRSFSAGQLPNHSSPSLLWQHGVVTTLAGCHTAELGPLIQATQTPLHSHPTLQQLNTPTSPGIT